MRRRRWVRVTPWVLAALAAPSHGHHSWPAVFLPDEVVVEGEIVKVHIRSPHSWIFVNVTGADGNVERWDVELGPASFVGRLLNDMNLEVGDHVMVLGNPGREHARWLRFMGFNRAGDDRFFGEKDPRSVPAAGE